MAKANIVEKHSLTVQGVVIIRDGKVLLDVEDIGGRDFAKMMDSFKGDLVKISVTKQNESLEEEAIVQVEE
nr:MAG TPA: YonK protein [Caudoviricetes sp.]